MDLDYSTRKLLAAKTVNWQRFVQLKQRKINYEERALIAEAANGKPRLYCETQDISQAYRIYYILKKHKWQVSFFSEKSNYKLYAFSTKETTEIPILHEKSPDMEAILEIQEKHLQSTNKLSFHEKYKEPPPLKKQPKQLSEEQQERVDYLLLADKILYQWWKDADIPYVKSLFERELYLVAKELDNLLESPKWRAHRLM